MADEQQNTPQSTDQSAQTQSESTSDVQNVQKNANSTPKMLGGITGKGFMPGQTGNPGGRPKRKPLSELYEQMLNDPELLDSINEAVKKAVRRGQMAMVLQLKEMADRVEGKVSQPIDANVNVGLSERLEAARRRLSES